MGQEQIDGEQNEKEDGNEFVTQNFLDFVF